MADMNYVSPLTSDLTDYYTKSEVDELQQGDAATYATSAEIVAGDNAVKGWVVSQGFLTEHQDLTNYATISYVDDAIAAIEPSSGGMAVRVVSTLPGVGEENVLYLVFVDNEDEDNRYAEYIWVDALNDYEMLGYGSSEGGIIPDLTDYATKQWVEAKGYLTAIDAKDVPYDNAASGLEAANVKNAIDEVYNYAASGLNNLSASSIMYDNSNSGLAAMGVQSAIDEVNAKVEAIDIPAAPDLSSYATKAELSAKANSADLAAVATTGSYNDLANKPAIPDVSSLTAEDIGYSNPDRYTYAQQITNVKKVINFLENRLDETVKSSSLATVATSGSYNDLTDKPTIPAAPDLTPYATKQELTAKADSASLASVATSGDYDDLTNKPTIPVLPTLATVATSGSYNDLSDKPSIQEGGLNTLAGALFALLTSDNNINYIVKTASTKSDVLDYYNQGYIVNYTGSSALQLSPEDFGTVTNITYYDFQVTNIITGAYSTGFFTGGNVTMAVNSNTMICKLTDVVPMRFSKRNGTNWREVFDLIISKTLLKYTNTTSGLTATTIQAAIDELAAASGGSSVGYTYDSTTKTVSLSGVSDDNL